MSARTLRRGWFSDWCLGLCASWLVAGCSTAPEPAPDAASADVVGGDTGASEHVETLLAEAEIGPQGGMLASTDRGLTMQVPAGALTAPTTLRLYALDRSAVGKADRLPDDPWLVPTRRFRIEPVDLALSQPAWLTIHAPAADVPFIATAFDIGLYRRDGGGWQQLDLDPPSAAFDVFPAEPRSAGTTSKLGEIALRLHPPYVDAPTIHQIGTGSAISTKDGPLVAVGVGGILTIWGHGFGWDLSRVEVEIAGQKRPATACTNASVDFPLALEQPVQTKDVAVTVRVDGKVSNALTLRIAGLSSGKPVISSVSPGKAALRGSWVRLQGTFYGSDATRIVHVAGQALTPWRDALGQDWVLLPGNAQLGTTAITVEDGLGGEASEPWPYQILAEGAPELGLGLEGGGLWLPGAWAPKGETPWQPRIDALLDVRSLSGATASAAVLDVRIEASGGGAPAYDSGWFHSAGGPDDVEFDAGNCDGPTTTPGRCVLPIPKAALVGRGKGGQLSFRVRQSAKAYLGAGTPTPQLVDVVRSSNSVNVAIAGRSPLGALYRTTVSDGGQGSAVSFCSTWNQPLARLDVLCVESGVACAGATCAEIQPVTLPGLWPGAIDFVGGNGTIGARGRCVRVETVGVYTLQNAALGQSCKLSVHATGGGMTFGMLKGLSASEGLQLSLGGGAVDIPPGALPALPDGGTYTIDISAPHADDPANPPIQSNDPQQASEIGSYSISIVPQPVELLAPIALTLPLQPNKIGTNADDATIGLVEPITGFVHFLQSKVDAAAATITVTMAPGLYQTPTAKPTPSAPAPVLPGDFNVAFGKIVVLYRTDTPGVLVDPKDRVRVEYVPDSKSKDACSEEYAANILSAAVKTWELLDGKGWSMPKGTVTIFVRKTVSWASSTAKGATTGGFLGQPQVTVRSDLGAGEARYVTAHELAHVVQRSYTTNLKLSWLDEAAADWVAWHSSDVDYDLAGLTDGQDVVRVVRAGLPDSWSGVDQASIYGSAVWLMWLAGAKGDPMVRALYEALDWSPSKWLSAHATFEAATGEGIGTTMRAFAEAFWLQTFDPVKDMSLSAQLAGVGVAYALTLAPSGNAAFDLSQRPPLSSTRYRMDVSVQGLAALGPGDVVIRASNIGDNAEVAVFAEAKLTLDPTKPVLLARLGKTKPILVLSALQVGSTFFIHNRWAKTGLAAGASLAFEVPRILSLGPSAAKAGDQVTVSMRDAGAAKGAVHVGGLSVKVLSWSATTAVFEMPDLANTASATVRAITAEGAQTNDATIVVKQP